jgi:hypothetical protein
MGQMAQAESVQPCGSMSSYGPIDVTDGTRYAYLGCSPRLALNTKDLIGNVRFYDFDELPRMIKSKNKMLRQIAVDDKNYGILHEQYGGGVRVSMTLLPKSCDIMNQQSP